MKTKYIITLIIAAVFASGLSGCSLLRKRVEKTEKVEYKFSSLNKERISLNNSNGDIKITRTDDTLGIVTVEAVKSADVRFDEQDKPIDYVTIDIDTTGTDIKIETEIRNNNGLFKRDKGGKVEFNIKVPAGLDVKIDNTNGDITLIRLDSDIDIETVNSAINLNKCTGSIKIDGVNGGVHANMDSTKGINIELVNGIIKLGGLKNVSAEVEAETINGSVTTKNLQFDNLISEKKNFTGTLGTGKNPIKVSTVNGKITFDGNYISYKKDVDINLKIDFSDDEHIKVIEGGDDDYDTEEKPKAKDIPDTNDPRVPPQSADSIKNKK